MIELNKSQFVKVLFLSEDYDDLRTFLFIIGKIH